MSQNHFRQDQLLFKLQQCLGKAQPLKDSTNQRIVKEKRPNYSYNLDKQNRPSQKYQPLNDDRRAYQSNKIYSQQHMNYQNQQPYQKPFSNQFKQNDYLHEIKNQSSFSKQNYLQPNYQNQIRQKYKNSGSYQEVKQYNLLNQQIQKGKNRQSYQIQGFTNKNNTYVKKPKQQVFIEPYEKYNPIIEKQQEKIKCFEFVQQSKVQEIPVRQNRNQNYEQIRKKYEYNYEGSNKKRQRQRKIQNQQYKPLLQQIQLPLKKERKYSVPHKNNYNQQIKNIKAQDQSPHKVNLTKKNSKLLSQTQINTQNFNKRQSNNIKSIDVKNTQQQKLKSDQSTKQVKYQMKKKQNINQKSGKSLRNTLNKNIQIWTVQETLQAIVYDNNHGTLEKLKKIQELNKKINERIKNIIETFEGADIKDQIDS